MKPSMTLVSNARAQWATTRAGRTSDDAVQLVEVPLVQQEVVDARELLARLVRIEHSGSNTRRTRTPDPSATMPRAR